MHCKHFTTPRLRQCTLIQVEAVAAGRCVIIVAAVDAERKVQPSGGCGLQSVEYIHVAAVGRWAVVARR